MKINKKMKIDRVFIDKVLGMTESRKDMEDKLMELLEIKDYHKATEKEKRLLRKLDLYILGRDMQIIELSGKAFSKQKKVHKIKEKKLCWSDFCYKSLNGSYYVWDLGETDETLKKLGYDINFEKDI